MAIPFENLLQHLQLAIRQLEQIHKGDTYWDEADLYAVHH